MCKKKRILLFKMCCCFHVSSLISTSEAAEGRLGHWNSIPTKQGASEREQKQQKIRSLCQKGTRSWRGYNFQSVFLFPNVSAPQSAHQELLLKHVYARVPALHSRVRCPAALASGQSCCFVWCDHVQRQPVQAGPPCARCVHVTTPPPHLPLKSTVKDVFAFKSVPFGSASWVTQQWQL